MYWTLDEHDGIPAVTLCERHALEATNIPAGFFGLGPYKTMSEAALDLDMVVATFGGGTMPDFGFTTSETGHCGACDYEAAQAAASEESA